MKNSTLSIAIAIIIVLFISACHKSSSSPATPTTTTAHGTLTATINGQPFSSNYCTIGSFVASTTGIKGVNIVGSVGANAGAPDISLSIANYVTGATGTYTIINDSTYLVYASVDSTNYSGSTAQTGTITISSSTSRVISGTFSLVLADGTTVTNGVFTAVHY